MNKYEEFIKKYKVVKFNFFKNHFNKIKKELENSKFISIRNNEFIYSYCSSKLKRSIIKMNFFDYVNYYEN